LDDSWTFVASSRRPWAKRALLEYRGRDIAMVLPGDPFGVFIAESAKNRWRHGFYGRQRCPTVLDAQALEHYAERPSLGKADLAHLLAIKLGGCGPRPYQRW